MECATAEIFGSGWQNQCEPHNTCMKPYTPRSYSAPLYSLVSQPSVDIDSACRSIKYVLSSDDGPPVSPVLHCRLSMAL